MLNPKGRKQNGMVTRDGAEQKEDVAGYSQQRNCSDDVD